MGCWAVVLRLRKLAGGGLGFLSRGALASAAVSYTIMLVVVAFVCMLLEGRVVKIGWWLLPLLHLVLFDSSLITHHAHRMYLMLKYL